MFGLRVVMLAMLMFAADGGPVAARPATAAFGVPALLSSSDAEIYRAAFAQARAGQPTAIATAARATNSVLANHIAAETLIATSAATRNPTAVGAWLDQAGDLPQAPALYLATNQTFRKPAELGNRWGQWRWPRAARPPSPSDKAAAAQVWALYASGQLQPAHQRAVALRTPGSPDTANGLFVGGLAAWRLEDFASAQQLFTAAANTPALSPDMLATTSFWAARAAQQVGDLASSATHLATAAATGDTFYGLLATRMLGLKSAFSWAAPVLTAKDWRQVGASAAVQRALALHQIGEFALASDELRNWWGRAPETHWAALLRLAGALDLHCAQLSLARRSLAGVAAPMASQYPLPAWSSTAGPNVSRALVFAFMRQESAFKRNTVSRSNARGPMQFLPATARDVAQDFTITEDDARLNDPGFAIGLARTYLKQLANSSITQGNLLKIMASYNGGPGTVRRWAGSVPDSDPLLYLESIPLTETRDYVETVMKNYWMYQLRLNEPMPTLDAIAAGTMPQFPGVAPRRTAQATPGRTAGSGKGSHAN